MKKLLIAVLLLSQIASAGTITGTIVFQSSGTPLKNGIITLQLSQPSYAVGIAAVTNQPFTCATDGSGNVVGIGDPSVLPVMSTGAGSLPSGTYFIKYTWRLSTGETKASPESTQVLASTGSLIVGVPATVPATATAWRIYIGTSSGAETLQATVSTPLSGPYTQSTALTAGSALPSSNTTVCSFYFNDELLPSNTNYSVNVATSSGAQLSGYPQKSQFYGGANATLNVSGGFPTSSNGILYPTPIQQNPPNSATQSINGSLSLNGFNLLGVGAVVSNSSNPAGSGIIELANTDKGDSWRNAASTADVSLSDAGAAASNTGNLADLLFWSGGGYQGGAFVDQSANPARSGVVRTGNNVCAVASRNAANSADACAVQVDGNNVTNIGASGGAGVKINFGSETTSHASRIVVYGARETDGQMIFTTNVSRFFPVQPVTLERILAEEDANSVGCTTLPSFTVSNGTVSQTLSIPNGTNAVDSGALAVNFPAGTVITLTLNAAGGCTTAPLGGHVQAQFIMQ